MQTNPQEQLINMGPDPTTLINQTRKAIKWPTIIIFTIFAITGQSIARLLESFHQHNTNQSLHDPVWTQPFLHVIGFPLLLFPFLILSSKQHKPLLISSNRSSIALLYLCTGVIMVVQVKLYVKGKLELSVTKFHLIEVVQLSFTVIFTRIIKKIEFSIWIVISLIFTITIATLSSTFDGEWSALLAAFTFSFLLCNIHSIFISTHNRKPRLEHVLELLIFSSFFATVAIVSIFGKSHTLKKEMNEFSKGKIVYVLSMVGQATAWQVYWVGIVGLVVSADSMAIPNVISLCTYSIVTALKILFCNYEEDEFDGFLGAALVLSVIAVATCFYEHHIGFGNLKIHPVFRFLLFFAFFYFYISEFQLF